MPRRGMKFKKYHKLKVPPLSTVWFNPDLGSSRFRLIAQEPSRITRIHLEACRRAIRRAIRKEGRISWPGVGYRPISAKPSEIRMGKGKGVVSYWAMPIIAGTTIVGMSGLFVKKARKALSVAATKLPIRTVLDTKDFFIDWDDFIDFAQLHLIKKRRWREPLLQLRSLKPELQ